MTPVTNQWNDGKKKEWWWPATSVTQQKEVDDNLGKGRGNEGESKEVLYQLPLCIRRATSWTFVVLVARS